MATTIDKPTLTWPQTMDFIGLNKPVGKEWERKGLKVEGVIPADVRGVFYRAVPDPAFVPFVENDTVLSGDGMISKMLFNADGSVDYAIRYVDTARHQAEVKAGKSLFGRYRNRFTDDPSVEGVDRTVANTTPVWHAGTLLMTKEDGRAYRINPDTLATLGSYDFQGVLKSETMTAHVRIDPETREMFFYGYEAAGLCSPTVAYCIVDPEGTLVREQWFDAPYCAMMHDFVISQKYALFPIFPTTADIDRLKAGGDHWVHEPERESWIGIMPRYGDVSEVKWVKGPKGVHSYHMMNAFDGEDGLVHIDLCISDSNAFEFIRKASGIERAQHELQGGLMRWTIDPAHPEKDVVETPLGPPGDMPRVADKDQGRPYNVGWYLTMNPEMQGPPLIGGPVYAGFNMMLKIAPGRGVIDALSFPPQHAINEPVHVPSSEPGHEGWLMAMIDRQTGDDDFEHEVWIIDAGKIHEGPVAKVTIPERQRPQVHGWWVPLKDYEAAIGA